MGKAKIVGQEPARKLKAVLGTGGDGIFFQTLSGKIKYLNIGSGVLSDEATGTPTLERVLAMVPNRQPVYEGDVVQIEF